MRHHQRPPGDVDGPVEVGPPGGTTLGLAVVVGGNLEPHLHVVSRAPAADPSVKIPGRRGGDEVVVFPRLELHASGSWGKAAEGYGEVHELVRLVALGDHSRVGVGDPARVELLLADTVDDVPLNVLPSGTSPVQGTDYIDLVILPWLVAVVDIDDVVCVVYAEDRIGSVPVHVVVLPGRHRHLQEVEEDQE